MIKAPNPPGTLSSLEQGRVLDGFSSILDLIRPPKPPGELSSSEQETPKRRWAGLDLHSSPEMMRVVFNKLERLPSVNSLRISFNTKGLKNGQQFEPPDLSVKGVFNPKNLSVDSFFLRQATVPLQFDMLTDLEANMLSINELLNIITQAPKLCTLRASCITCATPVDQQAFPMPTVPILHRDLLHLDIESSQNNRFIRHLTLPSLQSLRYTFHENEDHNNGLSQFFTRSGIYYGNHYGFPFGFQSLKLLDLTFKYEINDRNNPYVDGNWYDQIPSLTQLHIWIPPIHGKSDDNILLIGERLLHRLDAQRDPLVFPHLKQFRITAPRLSSTSWSHLSKMLRPANVQEVNGQDVRFLDRISVRLTGSMKTDDFFKPGIGISEDDCVRFLQTDQKSKVCIDFKAEPNSLDLLSQYCKLYQLIPAENEAAE